YHAIGARIPRGVLLVGPPGTGKTLLARAVAGEAGVPFFSISASAFVEMFVDVGASRVRDLFEQAKAASPAVVVIDELARVGRRPAREGREGILRIHTRHLPLAPDVDLAALAAGTTGFSGADLANLANEAALVAARLDHPQFTRADFAEAQDKVLLGGVRRLLLSEEDRRLIAYHEGGHAVVAWFTPGADPVQKVTIIP